MKRLILNGAAAVLALAVSTSIPPSFDGSRLSQNQAPRSPASDSHSEPGVRGGPGTESGLTVEPSGTTVPDKGPQGARMQDESGVRGLSDTESGDSAKPKTR